MALDVLYEKYEGQINTDLQHTNPTYAAMIYTVDQAVGRIIKCLKEGGIEDETVIIFTSDNGGLSHIGGKHINITDNRPLRAGKGSAYEGGVRVPLIIKWPGVTKKRSICMEPVTSVDIFSTIIDIADVKSEKVNNKEIDGTSIVPLLKDCDTQLFRDAIFWHYPHYHRGGATPYGAVRKGKWKLIEFYEDMNIELYNLDEDIGEENDLSGQRTEKARELKKDLHCWRKKVKAQMPVSNPNHDSEKDGFLKFGY